MAKTSSESVDNSVSAGGNRKLRVDGPTFELPPIPALMFSQIPMS